MSLPPILKCKRTRCDPSRRQREGADHMGIDIFIRCQTCGREGPYVECIRGSDEIREMVHDAWNAEVQA